VKAAANQNVFGISVLQELALPATIGISARIAASTPSACNRIAIDSGSW